MNHTEEELSLEFYHYVCNIVGSDDVVKTRRVFFTIMDHVNWNGVTTFISSGSKAEGLDIKGSDFDTMLVIDCMQCSPDRIQCYFADARYSLEEQTVFNRMRQRVGLIATCKNLIIRNVVFNYPFTLLPTELTRLPRVYNFIYVPSVVYCHVILFLCFHHLRDARGKLTARRDLQLTIKERYFIRHDEITLKIVYQCLDIVKALV
ncbi:unnamed protein product [Mytilus edulis]|uniref:Uncharacterized protein n=1 Tax=Mytilus edulis TaxID=6550 RepID=A0A8S3TE60_MYTED|nr:unnamed protein product [Mytilus edulis]